jgi:hypothetical protein
MGAAADLLLAQQTEDERKKREQEVREAWQRMRDAAARDLKAKPASKPQNPQWPGGVRG